MASITYLPLALLSAYLYLQPPINRIGFSGEFSICIVYVCALGFLAAPAEKCAFHVPNTKHIFAIAFGIEWKQFSKLQLQTSEQTGDESVHWYSTTR